MQFTCNVQLHAISICTIAVIVTALGFSYYHIIIIAKYSLSYFIISMYRFPAVSHVVVETYYNLSFGFNYFVWVTCTQMILACNLPFILFGDV